jgi:hypothetical protein
MKFWLLFFLCILAIKGFSQEKSIAGIVFDRESQGRIAKINVVNLNSGQSVYNNLNGVFTIEAQPGDLLVFQRQEYISDTVKVQNTIPIAVYMRRSSIQLKEVTIVDTALTPEKKLAETKREYNKVYGSLAYHDFLSTPSSGGAGLSIDALYNAFSRSGRNAKHLRNIIDRDYKQDVIDFRFNRSLVEKITGLKDKKLTDFMQKYRPGYFFVLNASDYEFITSIKTNYRRYLRNPKAYTLAPLTPAKE